jgi:hypothetical protein
LPQARRAGKGEARAKPLFGRRAIAAAQAWQGAPSFLMEASSFRNFVAVNGARFARLPAGDGH